MRESHAKRISTRERLWKKQKGICAYCGRKIRLDQASLDHIIPVEALDKPLGDANLIVTCIACNKRKGNRIIFTNLFDRRIYPMIEIPYFFQVSYITYNKKDRKTK